MPKVVTCQRLSMSAIVLTGFLLLTGCVTKSTYNDVVAERDEIIIENLYLRQQVAEEADFAVELSAALVLAESEIAVLQLEQEELADEVAEWAVRGAVKMQLLADGLHILLPHDVLFASGSVELKPEGLELLSELAEEIKLQPYQIAVLGFTDNVPVGPKMRAQFPSNWEVAGARAASVVRLLQAKGLPPAQLVAVSRGENQPIASNDTAEGRAQNRRIDIRIRPIIKN